MSDHNFEDRFFKTRRILELTIFFFLAFSLLSFSFAFEPIAKKITNLDPIVKISSTLQITNPTLISKPIVEYRPTITANIIEESRNARKENYNLVGKALYRNVYLNTKFIDKNATEDEEFILPLENYVDNNFNLDYNFNIENGNNIQNGSCKIEDKTLKCNFYKDYYGTQNLSLTFTKLFWDDDYLTIKLNVQNSFDAPILDESKLNDQNRVREDLNVNVEKEFDLDDYIIEIDNSNTIISSNPDSSERILLYDNTHFTLYILNNILLVWSDTPGSIDYTVNYKGVNIPFLFVFQESNKSPKYIGNLGKGETVVGTSYSKTFDLSELFEDPENDALTYDCVVDNTNVANYDVSRNGSNCTLGFNNSGFVDLNFSATDSSNNTAFYTYRVALLNTNDIEFIFDDYNKDSFKVVDTQAFDLPLKLKGLNFDVYDLNISIEGLENNQTFDFNLLKDENIEFVFEDLVSSEPRDYTITPIINYVPFTESQVTVLSIANNAESLAEYFEIYPNVLGDYFYDDDNNPTNDYVPAGIKFVLPFAIENKLNVDVQVEQCFGVYKNGFDNIYSKIDNNFIKSETKSICYNNLLLAKEIKNIDSIIELNLAEGDGSAWKTIYYDLKYNGIEFNGNEVTIFVENDKVLNKTYEYLNITDRIIEPSKGFFDPFYTNYPYTLDSNFSNRSVYEFLDINVCLFTAIYYKDIDTYINTNIENKYGFVSSPNCYVVSSIKYNGLNNKTKLPTFGFNILDNLTLNNEEFAIIFGYYKNKEFTFPYKNRGEIVEPVNGIFNFGG